MKLSLASLGLLALAASLSACGTNQGDRALSGAVIGAGSGAAIGAAFGGVGVIPGTVVGAVAGGATGVLTSPRAVDLGPPAWRR